MAVYMRIKNPTPPRGELCRRVMQLSSVGVCMCVRSWRLSICQWNITTANKLWDCFALSERPGWINLSWEINKSGVVLSQALFSPLSDGPGGSWAFSSVGSTASNQRSHNGGGHLSLHQRLSSYFFTASASNEPLWCHQCFITSSTDADAPQAWSLFYLLLKKWSNLII